MFLDADDMLKKNVLLKVSAFFDQHYNEIDLVVYPLKYKHGKKFRLRNHIRYKTEYKKGTGIYNVKEYPNCIQTTVNYVIKNFVDDNQLFNETVKFSEDVEYGQKI